MFPNCCKNWEDNYKYFLNNKQMQYYKQNSNCFIDIHVHIKSDMNFKILLNTWHQDSKYDKNIYNLIKNY